MGVRSNLRLRTSRSAPWRAWVAAFLLFAALPGLLELHADHPAPSERAFKADAAALGCHPALGDHLEAPSADRKHPCAACLLRLALRGLELTPAATAIPPSSWAGPLAPAALSQRSTDISASSSRGPPRA